MKTKILLGTLLALSLSQMLGYALGIRPLRGLAAATAAAPCPLVFSDVDGIETFASEFVLKYRQADGTPGSLVITPEVYARLKGPYNRRNVYGAALSYGPTPRFPKPLFDAVYDYAVSDPAPLAREVGLPEDATNIELHIRTLTEGRDDSWILPTS